MGKNGEKPGLLGRGGGGGGWFSFIIGEWQIFEVSLHS